MRSKSHTLCELVSLGYKLDKCFVASSTLEWDRKVRLDWSWRNASPPPTPWLCSSKVFSQKNEGLCYGKHLGIFHKDYPSPIFPWRAVTWFFTVRTCLGPWKWNLQGVCTLVELQHPSLSWEITLSLQQFFKMNTLVFSPVMASEIPVPIKQID